MTHSSFFLSAFHGISNICILFLFSSPMGTRCANVYAQLLLQESAYIMCLTSILCKKITDKNSYLFSKLFQVRNKKTTTHTSMHVTVDGTHGRGPTLIFQLRVSSCATPWSTPDFIVAILVLVLFTNTFCCLLFK